MKGEELPAHGGVGEPEFDVAQQRGVVVLEKIEPIEPPCQAIKQWIPADDNEPSFHWQDAHHSNESQWKPREVPLDDDRILVLDVD